MRRLTGHCVKSWSGLSPAAETGLNLLFTFFSDVKKPGEDGASPLHYAARFRASTARPSASRQVSQVGGDGIDGEVSSVVAPLTQALSADSMLGGDANHTGVQV